jgi:NADPH-dependent glutamate synthase beta subunit-like oxidoreductase
LSVEEREGSFIEVNCGFDPETAIAEAQRCLNCDLEIVMVHNGGSSAEELGSE